MRLLLRPHGIISQVVKCAETVHVDVLAGCLAQNWQLINAKCYLELSV